MSRLEFLAEDETPGRVSIKKVYTQLVSPLRVPPSALPRLELSPSSPTIAAVNESTATAKTAEPQTDRHTELVEELSASLRASEALNAELQQQLEAMQIEHTKIMMHHNVMTNSISELNDELCESREALQRTAAQLQSALHSNTLLTASVRSLETDKADLTNQVAHLEKEVESHRGRFAVDELLCNVEAELELAKKSNAQLKREVEKLSQEKLSAEAERDRAAKSLSHATVREQALAEELTLVREESRVSMANATKQTDLVRKKMKTLLDTQKQLESAKTVMSSQEMELEKKFHQLNDIAQDIECVAQIIADSGFDGFTARVNPRAQLKWIKCHVEALLRSAVQVVVLSKQVDECETRCKAAETAAGEAESKLRDVTAELALKARELDQAVEAHTSVKKELEGQLRKVTDELNVAVEAVDQLKRQQNDRDFLSLEVQSKIEVLEMQRARDTTEMKSLIERCGSLEQLNAKLRLDLDSKSGELTDAQRTIQTLRQTRRAMEADLQVLSEQINKITKQKDAAQTQARKLAQREAEVPKSLVDLEKAAKAFVVRHGGKTDDIAGALDLISGQLISDTQEKLSLTKQLVANTERIAFLEAEVNVRLASTSPEYRSKSEGPSPNQHLVTSPRLLTPRERRALLSHTQQH